MKLIIFISGALVVVFGTVYERYRHYKKLYKYYVEKYCETKDILLALHDEFYEFDGTYDNGELSLAWKLKEKYNKETR